MLKALFRAELFDHRRRFARVSNPAYNRFEVTINLATIAPQCTGSMRHAAGHMRPAWSTCVLPGVLLYK